MYKNVSLLLSDRQSYHFLQRKSPTRKASGQESLSNENNDLSTVWKKLSLQQSVDRKLFSNSLSCSKSNLYFIHFLEIWKHIKKKAK